MGLSRLLWIFVTVNVLWSTGRATDSLQEPRFITQPSGVSNIVIENRTKILQCQARGYPQPKYRWFKDGVALSEELTSEPFWRIQSPKRKDAGVYYCVATNDVGSIFSERVTFSVAYMGVFEDPMEKVVTVEYGGAAILALPAIESYPAPDVTWSTPDGNIPYDIKYAVTQSQLLILNVNERDEGSYRALAMNTHIGREEYSPFFKLRVEGDPNVEVPPTIIVAPQDTKIVKDETVSYLHCIPNARSLHELGILWSKDGIPIENTMISHSFNDLWNRTLVLISANSTYSGVYTCHVHLRSGGYPTINASAQVEVFEKPIFVSELKRETHGEYGARVEIPCEVVGVPSPKIQWFHNAAAVEEIGSKYHIEEDGSLVIKRLTMEHAGMFQCLAVNEAGEASSYTWLKVKTSTPILETSPRNLTVLDGKDATIVCRAVGAPIPNTTWLVNDTKPVEIAGRVQLLESGDLFLSAVKLNDAGKYTCVRFNDAGSVNGSAYLSVHVRTQIIRPPSDTSVLLGHTAELQCKVSNDPSVPYDIDWFHNSQLMNTRASPRVKTREDGALEIIAVRASDVGEYTCSVLSPGGNETRSARLSVIELPFAPINIQAGRLEKISPRAINVTWVPGFDGNSPTKKFVVERRVVPEMGPIADTLSNWAVENDNVSAKVRWCLLKDLKAAAAYQFRVTAVNLVGEGPPSEPSNIVALPQEPPSGPPVGLVGSARSDSEIITQWQPPLEEHRNGHILGYILRYRLHGYYNQSPWITHNITNEAQKNYLISDLITWKDYIVQIAAYNDKGVGVFTDGLIIKTKEGVPEAPPTNVRAEPVNSTAIMVWWKPPNPQKINGINQGYKIQAWIGGNFTEINEYKYVKVPPSLFDPLAEQSAVISGLRKYTLYNITVLCFTDPGDGERSIPIEIRTSEDVPGEVENLQFDDISDRALTVRWSPPAEINGVLTSYQLKYQIKDNPDSIRVLNFTHDQLSSKVERLQPTTHYRFQVIAWTSKGPSKPKVATIQSGVEPVLPQPPLKLALSNIDAFSVVLQFTPGFDGNSSIIAWTVQAQTRRNTTWYKIFEVSDPDASTITVEGLIPFMQYKLRLIANNVVGASKPSEPTKEFQTIQAPPSHPPRNVTVRAMSATELRVRWIPLQQIEWYGNPRGYNVTYTEVRTNRSRSIPIEDHTANSYVLEGMEEFALYEIVMQAYNDVGSSSSSPKAVERTREAVPSVGPASVEANATSSTTILVRWGEVAAVHQNGQIEGYKVYYGAAGSSFQYKNIPKNATFTTTLTELRKFVQYHVQVLAYTRLGDGALSVPPVRVQTYEDVPGPPSNVSFPDVSFTTARIIWDTPEDPNGEILAYRVAFHLNSSMERQFSKEFPASDRTFQANGLESEKYYMFSVAAQTRLGWGKSASGLVLTTNNRERPQPPSMPQISRSQVQSRQITFSWTPGPDGFAPLRYYTVQRSEGAGPFQTIPERVDPSLTSWTGNSLKPFTYYQFRIQATNDIGPSEWSDESVQVQTLPAAPARGVTGLRVVPITTTSIEVHWDVIEEVHWSGDHETGGYRVVYQPVSDFPTALEATPKQEILGIKKSKMILSDLMEDRNYEIVVLPFNSEGDGPASPPVTVYVGEAVPTGEPQNVKTRPISSTEVSLQWKPPLANMQNGDLLGYKIFYFVTDSPQPLEKKQEEEIEVVPASYLAHNLVFLDKFTEYRIQVLAFNPAGDGPRSPPITVRTKQDLPGPPANLQFSEITMTSMRVTWDPPKMRNGEIVGYMVTYETAEQNDKFSKQVKQKVTETSLLVQPLEEEVTYTLTVRALTIDFGPAISGNVTTGPQEGSPMAPTKLSVTKTPVSSVDLQWVNGASGKGPILGYYVETKRKDDSRWQTIVKTNNGPLMEYSVSYQNLLPSTAYLFRIISYNRYGISYPAYSSETVVTPSKLYFEYAYLQHKPFYRQTWFMVTLAASSIVIIIMVVAVLCVKSKSYKYKQEAQKTLEESMAMDIDDRQASDLSLYRTRPSGGTLNIGSACGTLGKRSTLARKSMHPPPPPMHGKSPPRPSPASVAYHSDEESLKGYDENPDDSSVTEKPSEISSTDSQGSESENESVQSDPHSFVNHYANVNDSLRQSWKRQKPVRNYSSYTDSEPEGSAVVSLNGGQIIMNNMARSRAPLPGFSSFV